MRRRAVAVPALALLLLLSGCGDLGQGEPPEAQPTSAREAAATPSQSGTAPDSPSGPPAPDAATPAAATPATSAEATQVAQSAEEQSPGDQTQAVTPVAGEVTSQAGAEATATTPAPAQGAAQTVSFGGVTLQVPVALAGKVEPAEVAAAPMQRDTPPGDETPANLHFSFVDYVPGHGAEVTLLDRPFPPQMLVYETAGFAEFGYAEDGTVGFDAELAKLQALLQAQPDLAQQETLPFLPINAGSQVLHAAPAYLAFEGGAGIRYLTAYRQDLAPLVEGELFYTFQGVTGDGSRFVVATFPLDTGVLPAEIPQDLNYEQWASTAPQYLADLTAQLSTAAADSFIPSLELLDGVIQSLQIEQ
jgi:hypothetical protein